MPINNPSKDFVAAEKKALQVGAKKFFLEVSIPSLILHHRLSSFFLQDLKREFVTELIYPAVQANCIYEV